MPWLPGAQGNRSRRLQGTFYGAGIMVPYRCVIVGFHRHVGMDTTDSERVWKDISREGTETKQRNRNNFLVDTRRSGVLSCRLLTPIKGKSRLCTRHARCRRRPLGQAGLATLALRQLNRQPTGVLALHCIMFRKKSNAFLRDAGTLCPSGPAGAGACPVGGPRYGRSVIPEPRRVHGCGCSGRCTAATPGDCTRDQHL
jgi:hypothetical protein